MDRGRFDAWTRRFAALDRRRVLLAAAGLLSAVGFGAEGAAKDRPRSDRRRGEGRDDADRDGPAASARRRKGKGKGKGKGKPNPPKRCFTDADCGECGFCTVSGFCQASDARCADCRTCNKRTLRCGGGCDKGKVCCDGACAVPGPDTCCTKSEHCGPVGGCLTCQIETGRCEPKPDGRECDGCKRCKDGHCAEPDDRLLCAGVCCVGDEVCVGKVAGFGGDCCPVANACADECCGDGTVCTAEDGCCPENRACGASSDPRFPRATCCDADERCVGGSCCPSERACDGSCCPDNHRCRRGGGGCCAQCLDGGACCPHGSRCINPGPFADNSCCDVSVNKVCGDNGDGTFKACCNPRTEECCDGECVPKGECCGDGRPSCEGTCCPTGFECCGGACIDTQKDMSNCGTCGNACVPKKERCHQGVCRDICSMNQGYTQTCVFEGAYFCCLPDKGCCGSRCCG